MRTRHDSFFRMMIFTAIAVLMLCFVSVEITQAQDLSDVFNAPACQRACWLGIEPGVTTQADLEVILADLGLPYRVVSLPDEDIYWLDIGDGPSLVADSRVGIHVWQEIVGLMEFNIDIPVEEILDSFGLPPYAQIGPNNTEIVYSDDGIVFAINKNNAWLVRLADAFVIHALHSTESGASPLLNCDDFAPGCPIMNVASFTLVDADTEEPIEGYDPIPMQVNPVILDLEQIGERNLAIRANVVPSLVNYVKFEINGSPYIDDTAPYITRVLNISGSAITITATSYDVSGEVGAPLSITLSNIQNQP